jgi:hypothetical protein
MAPDRAVCIECKRNQVNVRKKERRAMIRDLPKLCEACEERPREYGKDQMCRECIELANTIDELCSA